MKKGMIKSYKEGIKKSFKAIRGNRFFYFKCFILIIMNVAGNISIYFSGLVTNIKQTIIRNSLDKGEFSMSKAFKNVDNDDYNKKLAKIAFIKNTTLLSGLLIISFIIYILNYNGLFKSGINLVEYGLLEAILVIFIIATILGYITIVNAFFNYALIIITNDKDKEVKTAISESLKNMQTKDIILIMTTKFYLYLIFTCMLGAYILIRHYYGHLIISEYRQIILNILLISMPFVYVFSWFLDLNITNSYYNKLYNDLTKGDYHIEEINKEEHLSIIALFSDKGEQ